MTATSRTRILCVDDEPKVLSGLARRLRRHYEIVVATSGEEGLVILDNDGTIPVVLSDMRMPEMDGSVFLSQVRKRWPNTTRILLTGQADVEDTVAAVNHGSIFRFLTKPCPHDVLVQAIDDGISQHELITAEKDLLQNTLRGSVDLLTDILSLTSPMAFVAASRLKRYVVQITQELGINDGWDFELAAMLSQVGCVVVPEDILERVYKNEPLSNEAKIIYESRWAAWQRLIANIPRLEGVAAMIAGHQDAGPDDVVIDPDQHDRVLLGAQLLKLATDFDKLIESGVPAHWAIDRLILQGDRYVERLLAALKRAQIAGDEFTTKEVTLAELRRGAVLAANIDSSNGVLLIGKGQEITPAVRERLVQHALHVGIIEPIKIRAPRQK